MGFFNLITVYTVIILSILIHYTQQATIVIISPNIKKKEVPLPRFEPQLTK